MNLNACRLRDSNPHPLGPEPKSGVSANSTKAAYVKPYYIHGSGLSLVAGLEPITALGSTSSLNNSFMGYIVVNPKLQ